MDVNGDDNGCYIGLDYVLVVRVVKGEETTEQTKMKTDWEKEFWWILVLFGIVVVIISISYNIKISKLTDEKIRCILQNKELNNPEIIYGDLYIGYEDGVRIGYHQDYNGTWYRCARECGVIE